MKKLKNISSNLVVLCITLLVCLVLDIGMTEVKAAEKNGLVLENGVFNLYVNGTRNTEYSGLFQYDGAWFMLTNGTVDTSLVGMVPYDGELFYVADGRLVEEYSGLAQDGDNWYYVGAGMVQNVSQLVMYDNEWFVVKDGKLDVTFSGVYAYDGANFFVAAGMLDDSISGLHNAGGAWYYFANGQVADYTGLVEFDGAWFYVEGGKLAESYVGIVKYNGAKFNVVNGQVVEAPKEEKPEIQLDPSDLVGSVINQIIRADMTEFEKVKAIHDFMIVEIDYDYDDYLADTIPRTSRTVEGVLTTRYAVCQGYALTFKALCDRAGIACVYVTGYANSGAHAWNQVCVDGQWYNIDTTWDDPVDSSKKFDDHKYNTYTYFLLSDEDMYKDHTPYSAPYVCTAPSISVKAFAYGCPWLESTGYEYISYVETCEEVKKAIAHVTANELDLFQLVIDESKMTRNALDDAVEKSLIELGYYHRDIKRTGASGRGDFWKWNFETDEYYAMRKQVTLSSEQEIRDYIKKMASDKELIGKGEDIYLSANTFDMEGITKELLLEGIEGTFVCYNTVVHGYYTGYLCPRNVGYERYTDPKDIVAACDEAYENGEEEFLFLYDYRGTGMSENEAWYAFAREFDFSYSHGHSIYNDDFEGLQLIMIFFR